MSQFRDAYDEFRRHNVEVAAISVDSPYAHRVWAAELELPYPLLSDFAREFMESYRVPRRDLNLLPNVSGRSAFLADADSFLRYVWYPGDGRNSPPIDEVLAAVRALPPNDMD